MSDPRSYFVLYLVVASIALKGKVTASEPRPPKVGTERTSNYRPLSSAATAATPEHPLHSVLQDARQELNEIRNRVRDFRCRIVKRERIEGVLQDYQYIDSWIREESRADERIVTPLSIYMEFIGPASLAGRRVLYVDGRHEGEILVRKGGKRFNYVTTSINLHGASAKTQSLYPLTQVAFGPLLTAIIKTLERHAAADPLGENTVVQRIDGARLGDRSCSVLRITHPQKQDDLEFHLATLFVDNELRVPVRVTKCDWPSPSDQEPPLISEYNYVNVNLNVGLTEHMFRPAVLQANR